MNRSIAMLLIGLIFGGGIGFTIAAGAGVTLDGHDHSAHSTSDVDHSEMGHGNEHDHDQVTSLPEGPNAPSLTIEVARDGSGWNLRLITTNFTLTPERIGGTHIPGEGHAHVYLDDVKLARAYGEWYHIDKVPSGDVELRVTLNGNDHSVLAVGDELLEAKMVLPGN